MLKFCYFLIVAVAFLSCGCLLHPGYKVEKEGRAFITNYQLNKAAVARAIREHRLMYGMTMEEVVESWGNPELQHDLIINGKLYYSWAYRKNGVTRVIYFNRGILVDIK